jgi:hypothetical protein
MCILSFVMECILGMYEQLGGNDQYKMLMNSVCIQQEDSHVVYRLKSDNVYQFRRRAFYYI